MLDAALQLVSEGGYDALQVRAIAERASVSSRTIYENFASLDSLLIAAVSEHFERLFRSCRKSPPPGGTAAGRVNQLIDELTKAVTANRALAVAWLRALLSGKPEVGLHVRGVREILRAILASAISPEYAAQAERELAEILESTWLAALAGWASGADSYAHITEIMHCATQLLLTEGDSRADAGKQGFPSPGSWVRNRCRSSTQGES